MWILLNSLLYSWESEKKTLAKKVSDLDYNEIVTKFDEELERQIQSGIKRSSKSMNAFPWYNKMFRTLKRTEFSEREYPAYLDDE